MLGNKVDKSFLLSSILKKIILQKDKATAKEITKKIKTLLEVLTTMQSKNKKITSKLKKDSWFSSYFLKFLNYYKKLADENVNLAKVILDTIENIVDHSSLSLLRILVSKIDAKTHYKLVFEGFVERVLFSEEEDLLIIEVEKPSLISGSQLLYKNMVYDASLINQINKKVDNLTSYCCKFNKTL